MNTLKHKITLLFKENTIDRTKLIKIGISVLLMFFWCQTLLIKIGYSSWNFFQLGIGLLEVFLLGVLAFKSRFPKSTNITISILSIFSLWVLFSTYLNTKNDYTKVYFLSGAGNWDNLKNLLLMIYVPSIAAVLVAKIADKNVFADLYKTFMTLCATAGILEYITRIELFNSIIRNAESTAGNLFSTEYAYRLTLFFYHPIYYCVFLGFAFLVLLYRPYKNTVINYISVLLILVNMLLTQSRTGWVGTGITFLIFFFREKKYRTIKEKKLQLFISFSVTIAVLSIVFSLKKQMVLDALTLTMDRVNSMLDLSGGSIRIENMNLWGIAKKLPHPLLMKLFGGGYNFAISLLQLHPAFGWTAAVDNQYLTVLLNYGYIGLVLYVSIFILIIIKYLKTADVTNRMYCLCLISYAIVSWFFESNGGTNTITFTFFAFLGLLKDDQISHALCI